MTDTTSSAADTAHADINAKVLGEAPAMALGSFYQSIGNALALAAANAVYAQQQANVSYQAATTLGVSTLLGVETASAAHQTLMLTAQPVETAREQIEQQIRLLQQQLESLKARSENPSSVKGA